MGDYLNRGMEKQPSFNLGLLERLQSFKSGVLDELTNFKFRLMENQKSFRERRVKEHPWKRGDTMLHIVARAGNPLDVREILSCCCDAELKDMISRQNQDGETALYVASERGNVDVLKEILKASNAQSAAIKAGNGFDTFHIAARQGHGGVLKELLRSFPSLAMTTSSSNATTLDIAATQGYVDIVNLLLESDASLVKFVRNTGKTALHLSARMGHVEVVRSLLSKDPSIGLRADKKGQTALHMAVKGNNLKIVLELLKLDSSIANLEDNKGNTPLHIVTRKNRTEFVQTLTSLESIKVNSINRAGDTALSIAEKTGHGEISAILRDAGALSSIELDNHQNPEKHLTKTVSDIKYDVHSQLKQTQRIEMRVQHIKRRLQRFHVRGLSNAVNSNTIVAVLIATVAFASIFTMPGQFAQDPTDGLNAGQANIGNDPAFIIFLVFNSLALFISLAVVVVQMSLIVVEQKTKELMVFIINKLMWVACLFISISFISLTYIVVGHDGWWLALFTTAIGASIMLFVISSMCYFIVAHRRDEKSCCKNIERGSSSRSRSWSVSVLSDSEPMNSEHRSIYAL